MSNNRLGHAIESPRHHLLNRTFEAPVFVTFPGRRGGGAELTAFGERLVALYRSIDRRTRAAAEPSLAELAASLDPGYEPRGAVASEDPPSRSGPFRSQRS